MTKSNATQSSVNDIVTFQSESTPHGRTSASATGRSIE